ncbi:glycosyltransferase family 8 protein [Actinobacillus porcinus]|uniref:glycosyltransferase family 8 protein n=1 Tax=Actinobacillus porcinus TaxID=51048 RepID=UPI002A91CAE4|nr:glycosyltransferase family 8 protein [Actinobacillus porcinus]MDY6216264.1 glycosyltransferase family 8 protein [Actinobacillus porcinus]
MEPINILLAADKNYLPYLEISLKSLLAHNEKLSVFVLHTGDIPSAWADSLREHFAKRQSELVLCYLPPENLNIFDENGYITQATYLRYYIEELFPYASTPYWLYLDCDIVINGDVRAPFNALRTSSYPVAAVSDPYVNALPNHPYKQEDYFNAGVLYLDATRAVGINSALTTLTQQLRNQLIFGDQDVLNVYFEDNWLKLNRLYNYQLDHVLYKKQSLGGGKIAPFILHFTGPIKPLEPILDNNVDIMSVVSLFRLYHHLPWEVLVHLPLGSIQLKF